MDFRFFLTRAFVACGLFFGTVFFSASRAEAAGLPVFDGSNFTQTTFTAVTAGLDNAKEFILDGLAKMIAQQIIRKMTTSIVTWINSGFDGNPSFVTDPTGFFQDIGDQITGAFLSKAGLTFLCEPFKLNVRLSLILGFAGNRNNVEERYKCTLSGVIKNAKGFDDFMKGNFSQNGGWKSWFQITQQQSNNPLGAFIGTKNELDARIGDKKIIEGKNLDWGSGFMSWKTCDQTYRQALDQQEKVENPQNDVLMEAQTVQQEKQERVNSLISQLNKLQTERASMFKSDVTKNNFTAVAAKDREIAAKQKEINAAREDVAKATAELNNRSKQNEVAVEAANRQNYETQDRNGKSSLDECAKESVKTPGSVIQSQLNSVLPQELAGLSVADEINEIAGALANQLLTQALTGFQGLSGVSKPRNNAKSLLQEYEDDNNPAQLERIKKNLLREIKRSYAQLGRVRYLIAKNKALKALQHMEAAQAEVVSCYSTKLLSATLESRPIIEARLLEASSTLEYEIVSVRESIEQDILEVQNRVGNIKVLEESLAAATTPEEVEEIHSKVQDIIDNATNAKSQSLQYTEGEEDAILQSKADVISCQMLQ